VKRGRPTLHGEPGQRYQVTIPPKIAKAVRARGAGSLSRGIIAMALTDGVRVVGDAAVDGETRFEEEQT
jgi:hypothetical protein